MLAAAGCSELAALLLRCFLGDCSVAAAAGGIELTTCSPFGRVWIITWCGWARASSRISGLVYRFHLMGGGLGKGGMGSRGQGGEGALLCRLGALAGCLCWGAGVGADLAAGAGGGAGFAAGAGAGTGLVALAGAERAGAGGRGVERAGAGGCGREAGAAGALAGGAGWTGCVVAWEPVVTGWITQAGCRICLGLLLCSACARQCMKQQQGPVRSRTGDELG